MAFQFLFPVSPFFPNSPYSVAYPPSPRLPPPQSSLPPDNKACSWKVDTRTCSARLGAWGFQGREKRCVGPAGRRSSAVLVGRFYSRPDSRRRRCPRSAQPPFTLICRRLGSPTSPRRCNRRCCIFNVHRQEYTHKWNCTSYHVPRPADVTLACI
jgi:hypothetical protein